MAFFAWPPIPRCQKAVLRMLLRDLVTGVEGAETDPFGCFIDSAVVVSEAAERVGLRCDRK